MDLNDLINFNSPAENCCKMASPLIPLPVESQSKYLPRLSDVDNNPFDKALRNTMKIDDPFECSEESFRNSETSENKENLPNLISPFMTPVITKKQLKISKTPIYINENNTPKNSPLKRKDLAHVKFSTNSPKSNADDHNNSSLQFLSDSVFNDTLNCGFVDSNFSAENIKNFDNENNVPEIFLNGNDMNPPKGLMSRIKSVSSTTSDNNVISFNSDSLFYNDLSNIPSGTNLTKSQTLDKGFITDSISFEKSGDYRRRCASASRPPKAGINFNLFKRQLNNSFAGFQINDRNNFEELNCKHDSVLIEEQKMKKRGDASFVQAALDEELNFDVNTPPWMEENSLISEDSDVEEENVNKNNDREIVAKNYDEIDKNNCNDIINIDCHEEEVEIIEETELVSTEIETELHNSVENLVVACSENKIESDTTEKCKEISSDVQKAKNLLQNLTEILQCDGKQIDKRKLGESLLNSIALALDLDNSRIETSTNKIEQDAEQQVNNNCIKEVVKPKSKSKLSCIRNLESKIKIQASKMSLEKHLKVKNEKEKKDTKGPLKAVIPLKNMAKTRKSSMSKFSLAGVCTPPKIFKVNKTSTPNEPKLKPPVAQSTPNVTKPTNQGATTPTRQVSYMRSSLPRPSSTNDLNKSISPKNPAMPNTSVGSVQNHSQDRSANRSIPLPGNCSLYRRKSSSDIKSNKNLNKSLEEKTEKISKPSKLKRSTSFQSKYLKT